MACRYPRNNEALPVLMEASGAPKVAHLRNQINHETCSFISTPLWVQAASLWISLRRSLLSSPLLPTAKRRTRLRDHVGKPSSIFKAFLFSWAFPGRLSRCSWMSGTDMFAYFDSGHLCTCLSPECQLFPSAPDNNSSIHEFCPAAIEVRVRQPRQPASCSLEHNLPLPGQAQLGVLQSATSSRPQASTRPENKLWN